MGPALQLLHFLDKIAAATVAEILNRLQDGPATYGPSAHRLRSVPHRMHLKDLSKLVSLLDAGPAIIVLHGGRGRSMLLLLQPRIYRVLLFSLPTAIVRIRVLKLLLFVNVKETEIFLIWIATLMIARLKLVGELANLINTLQFAHQTDRTLMLLHVLVVVVESADGERTWHGLSARHDDTFAASASWGSDFDLFLGVDNQVVIGLAPRLFHHGATSAFNIFLVWLYLLACIEVWSYATRIRFLLILLRISFIFSSLLLLSLGERENWYL